MSHQNTPYMCQLGHEKFVLNCCLVAMVTNHVSNLQDISLQINVSCCYSVIFLESIKIKRLLGVAMDTVVMHHFQI